MSSPKVLVWENMSFDAAVEANLGAARHYLGLARQIHEQGLRTQRETIGLGGPASTAPTMDCDEADARLQQIYAANGSRDAGASALEFAHAYWQSLKHPWHELVLRRYGDAKADHDAEEARQRRALDDFARSVDTGLHLETEAQRVVVDGSDIAPVHSWPQRISACRRAILDSVLDEDLAATREAATMIAEHAEQPLQERWLALENLRLTVTQAAKQRRREAALQAFEREQQGQRLERIDMLAERCAERLEALVSPLAPSLEGELATLRAQLAERPAAERDEEAFATLDRRVMQESARQGLLTAAIAELHRLGYQKLQVMQTLGPGDVLSAYLQDEQDPDRMALLQISAEHSMISAEVVRHEANTGTSQQQHLDRNAQTRLCKAMAKAEEALAERWRLEVRSEQPPGGPVRVKAGLPRKARKIRGTAAAAQQARRLG